MALEPQVQESINRNRRKVLFEELLFICPHNLTKRQKAYMSLRDTMFMYGTSEETTAELLKREKEAINRRIENLGAITQGHWPAFSG